MSSSQPLRPSNPAVEMQSVVCRQLYEYWLGQRGSAIIPSRDQIEPGGLLNILPFIYIIEQQAPDRLIFRLAGTALRERLGREVTGTNMLDLMAPDIRRSRAWLHHVNLHHPCAFFMTRRVALAPRGVEAMESLFLPVLPRNRAAAPQIIAVSARRGVGEFELSQPQPFRAHADLIEPIDIGAGLPADLEPPADWMAA